MAPCTGRPATGGVVTDILADELRATEFVAVCGTFLCDQPDCDWFEHGIVLARHTGVGFEEYVVWNIDRVGNRTNGYYCGTLRAALDVYDQRVHRPHLYGATA